MRDGCQNSGSITCVIVAAACSTMDHAGCQRLRILKDLENTCNVIKRCVMCIQQKNYNELDICMLAYLMHLSIKLDQSPVHEVANFSHYHSRGTVLLLTCNDTFAWFEDYSFYCCSSAWLTWTNFRCSAKAIISQSFRNMGGILIPGMTLKAVATQMHLN